MLRRGFGRCATKVLAGLGGRQKTPELHRENAGKVPALFFMEVNPKPQVVEKLKKQAEAEGLTLNAYLMPFLNDIAAGRLVRVPHYPAPEREKKAA
jgi:hypothetical protein